VRSQVPKGEAPGAPTFGGRVYSTPAPEPPAKMDYGVRQLPRAWLGPRDVLNTLDAEAFLAGLRPRH